MPKPIITDPRRREINELLDRLGSSRHPDYSRLKYEIDARYPHYNPRRESRRPMTSPVAPPVRLEKKPKPQREPRVPKDTLKKTKKYLSIAREALIKAAEGDMDRCQEEQFLLTAPPEAVALRLRSKRFYFSEDQLMYLARVSQNARRGILLALREKTPPEVLSVIIRNSIMDTAHFKDSYHNAEAPTLTLVCLLTKLSHADAMWLLDPLVTNNYHNHTHFDGRSIREALTPAPRKSARFSGRGYSSHDLRFDDFIKYAKFSTETVRHFLLNGTGAVGRAFANRYLQHVVCGPRPLTEDDLKSLGNWRYQPSPKVNISWEHPFGGRREDDEVYAEDKSVSTAVSAEEFFTKRFGFSHPGLVEVARAEAHMDFHYGGHFSKLYFQYGLGWVIAAAELLLPLAKDQDDLISILSEVQESPFAQKHLTDLHSYGLLHEAREFLSAMSRKRLLNILYVYTKSDFCPNFILRIMKKHGAEKVMGRVSPRLLIHVDEMPPNTNDHDMWRFHSYRTFEDLSNEFRIIDRSIGYEESSAAKAG